MKQLQTLHKQRGWLQFVAAGLSVLSTAVGMSKAKKARKAQGRANAAQREINTLKNRQAKRQFLRQYRSNQAAALLSSVVAGVDMSSSMSMARIMSGESQARTGVIEFSEMERLGSVYSANMNSAQRHRYQGAMWQAGLDLAAKGASWAHSKWPGGDTTTTTPELPKTDFQNRTIDYGS